MVVSVSVDTISSASSVSPATPLTYSHVVNASPEGAHYLVVGVTLHGSSVVDSVTYDGVAMTEVRREVVGFRSSYLFVLKNPNTGTHSVVVTPAAGVTMTSGAMTLHGVSGDPLGASAGAQGVSSNPSVSVTSDPNDLTVDCLMVLGGAPVVGSGQTQRWSEDPSGSERGRGSTEAGAAPTVTMSWSDAPDVWAITTLSVHPAADRRRNLSQVT